MEENFFTSEWLNQQLNDAIGALTFNDRIEFSLLIAQLQLTERMEDKLERIAQSLERIAYHFKQIGE